MTGQPSRPQLETQLAFDGTKEHCLTAGQQIAKDTKSGPTAGKSGPTAGNSDPAERHSDVTGQPRDVLEQKDANASVGKSQSQGGIEGLGKAALSVPAYFQSVNQFAVLATTCEEAGEDTGNMEANATSQLYERKTPRNLKRRRGRPPKAVEKQEMPTPRKRKETKKRPSTKEKKGAPDQPSAVDRDPEDWMYSRERFHALDQEYGPFTLDAAASADGENAQCKAYCSAGESSFLEKKLHGETIWANFPYERADEFLSHYLEEKARDPSNAGMFVLPQWTSTTWWSKVQHMEMVKRHDSGEDLFTAPPKDQRSKERRDLGPSPWPVCIFWDPPNVDAQEASLEDDPRVETDPLPDGDQPSSDQQDPDPAKEEEDDDSGDQPRVATHEPHRRSLLIAHGRVHGAKARVLIDSGSQVDLISSKFVEQHRLPTALSPGEGLRVQLAGGQVQDASIVTQPIRVQLKHWSAEESFNVTELPEYDVILGKPWLTSHNPQINWRQNIVQLRTEDGKFVRVEALAPARSQDQQQQPGEQQQQGKPQVRMISQAKLQRIARQKGSVTFLGSVESVIAHTAVDEGQAAATSPCHGVNVAHTSESQERAARVDKEQKTPQEELKDGGLSQRVEAVANEFPDVFEDPQGMPPKRDEEHRIELEEGTTPPAGYMIRMSPLELDECKKQLADYCTKAHVRPSKSAFGAPVIFVRKKDGSLRMCIDYRKLNRKTKKDRYPMPRADELLDQLKGARVFTKLDLRSGYHQIRVAEEDIHKTAFRTKFGHYEFTVMPFGLTNAPATFQRMMNNVLRDFIDQFVVVYMDDILIFSRNEEEHKEHLRKVLERLREEKLYAKRSKCDFGATTVDYLGHTIGPDGVHMDQAKVDAVEQWPKPKGVPELRSFLGLTGYYRKFIDHYATRTLPMSNLLKKEVEWTWGKEQEESFRDLKEAMTSTPVLIIPDAELPYEVYTDSSAFGIGAVLLQDQGKGLQPCAYISHKLTDAECKYAVHEQELLGIIHALKTWRPYLEGASFKVNSDHRSLMQLATQPSLSRRQARWVEFLQAYDCKVDYVPGERNQADALSRRPDLKAPTESSDSAQLLAVHETTCAHCARLGVKPGVRSARPASHAGGPGTACAQCPKLRSSGAKPSVRSARPASHSGGPGTACAHGPKLRSSGEKTLVDMMNISVLDEDSSFLELVRQASEADAYPSRDRMLTNQDGLYYLGKRLYVPPSLRKHIVEELHASAYGGHFGAERTIDAISRRFFWPHIKRVAKRIVRECPECQRSKPRSSKQFGTLQSIPVPERPWQQITLDLVTDLPTTASGFDAILVFVDRLTKMVHIVPTHKKLGAEGSAHIFKEHVFKYHGLPEVIIGDRDRRWSGSFWSSVFRSLGTKIRLSTAYHPQTDGQTERANRVVEEMLRSYIHPLSDDWDKHLTTVEFAYNNSTQRSTGRSPFYVAYGFHPRTPADLYNPQAAEDTPAAQDFVKSMLEGHAAAKAALEVANRRYAEQYDKKKTRTPFSKGEWVLLDAKHYRFQGGEKHKLNQPWLGPYKIMEMLGPNAAKLELPPKVRVHPNINVSRLKAYKGRLGTDGRPLELARQRATPQMVVDDEHVEQLNLDSVEDIIASRDVYHVKRRKEHLRREYLVKFQGQSDEDNSWLTVDQLGSPRWKLHIIRETARGAIKAVQPVYRAR